MNAPVAILTLGRFFRRIRPGDLRLIVRLAKGVNFKACCCRTERPPQGNRDEPAIARHCIATRDFNTSR